MSATGQHLGWFSVLGFVILGLLAVGESSAVVERPLSVSLTAGLAALAGIGAVALWFGSDPTAETRAREA